MALVFMDGFDAYAASGASVQTLMRKKWADVSSSAATFAAGRTGGLAINSSTSAITSPVFTSQATWIIGFAFFRPTSSNNYVVVRFEDFTTIQFALRLNSSNILEIRNGNNGTLLATGSTTITVSTWFHIELKVTVDNAVGAVELRLDENAEASASNVDTQVSANASANKFVLPGNSPHYDDLYLLDTTGSTNNDFLGDMKIETLLPNAAGDNSAWTALSGTNFSNVDEQAVDNDTSYVFTKTVSALDTYNFPDLSAVRSNVKGVGTNIHLRKDRAGGRTVAPVIRVNTTDNVGTTVPVFDDYLNTVQLYDTNPDTAAVWAVSGVNTAEYGAKLIG